VKIAESDENLLRAVQATPGAVGILDVYAINSSVKVLRVDGKLPFDVGYALRETKAFLCRCRSSSKTLN